MYALKQRAEEKNYFATIRTESGGCSFSHVRTNLGRKVAYAMIAKHWDGHGKIESFRDEDSANQDDRNAIESGSDGVLRDNIWFGTSTSNEIFGA